MKAKDVEIGAKVRDVGQYPVQRGTIIGTKLSDGDEVVAVEWADGSLTKANINDLTVVDPELENDFQQIALCMKAAAKLINEANLLAKNHGTDISSLYYNEEEDIDLSISTLFNALNSAGWSASSMLC